MALLKSGSVGIGTTAPRGLLDLDKAALADTLLIIDNDVNATLDSTTVLFPSGGWNIGVPTGGDKGAGTLNAKAVYDDNTILTGDYVFEDDYMEEMNSIQEMETFYTKNKHLPTLTSKAELVEMGNMPVGQRLNEAIVTIENMAIYIAGLQKQVDELRARKN
jgi:hypothetical protein